MIPTENGQERPLGIPVLEDKLVQRAAAKLLSAIYEQDFIVSSYGYRPGRSARGAIEDLTFNLDYGCIGYNARVKATGMGKAFICRYADDFVCGFQYQHDAETFYQALPARLQKFNLAIAPEKTRLCRFSRFAPSWQKESRLTFLGFELWRGMGYKGRRQIQRRTAPRKLQGARQRILDWIKASRHLPKELFVSGLKRRLQGHYNYYGVIGNRNSLYRFCDEAIEQMFKWLNRRGGKRKTFSWSQLRRALPHLGLPVPPEIKPCKNKHLVFA